MPIIIVAGFGRCGSSLVMQMLEAGGQAVTGDWPAFELSSSFDLSLEWLQSHDDHAVKVLDPHEYPLPRGPQYKTIWLDRNTKHQSNSLAKFLNATTGQTFTKGHIKRIIRAYIKDRPKAMTVLRNIGSKVLSLQFEDLITKPRWAAERIAAFVGGLNIEPMVNVVLPRGVQCQPDMQIEMSLMESRHAKHTGVLNER